MLNIEHNEEKWDETAFCTRYLFFVSVASIFIAIERRKRSISRWNKQKIWLNARINIWFPSRARRKGAEYIKIVTTLCYANSFGRPSLVKQTLVIPINSKPRTYLDLCQTLRFKLKKNNIFDWCIRGTKMRGNMY